MFNVHEQMSLALEMERSMNEGQHHAYHTILNAVDQNMGQTFFLDGPGGSGKTFVYNALLSHLRGREKIALACASSGIAALLLSNGRTAHSRFKIPIDVKSHSTCNVKVTSNLANLIKQTALIVWDEAPMIHRHAFEALDKTLHDIMQKDLVFGGKTMLLGGDFQQILPVIPKGRREDIVGASLCNSNLWRHIKVLKLIENMRLIDSAIVQTERDFARWVLDIGNGNLHIDAASDDVNIPCNMLVEGNSIEHLIEHMYGSMSNVENFADFFKERGILSPKNKEVDMTNSLGLRRLGDNVANFRMYLSASMKYHFALEHCLLLRLDTTMLHLNTIQMGTK
ncbi:hypothetical protein L7F22_017381 [Adiantum nelumboides]|nr:hypothetical protein [Adiantum nelumboides]